MNVNDVKLSHERPEHLLKAIFGHQHELAKKYLHIEKSNGLLQTEDMPVDINCNKGQARIKDMSWRAMEEVGEALDALERGEYTHFFEEISDALHFLTEKYLLCGFTPEGDLCDYLPERIGLPCHASPHMVKLMAGSFVQYSGMSCNCLKNKPWKQTHILTDEKTFMKGLQAEFNSFMALCNAAGYSPETLFDMYMRKNTVNQFRQESGY